MTRHRPHHIQDHHLTRLAVVYRRTGSPQEVAEQSDLSAGPSHERELVMHWGWPEQAILTIDEARNASRSKAESPDGVTRVCELVAQKQVGILMMSIASGFPPSCSDLLRLFDLCRDTNTVVAIDGAVIEPDRWTDHLIAAINATHLAEANRRMASAITNAKRHYATEGRAVSNPPTGYIKVGKGQWAKDIPAVQQRIEDVFRLYDRLRSQAKVVRCLVDQELDMPIRTPSGKLQWVRPTVGRIHSIITNPTYAGYYVYGRHAALQGTRNRNQRNTTSQEQIVIPNHHDAYIPIEEWHRINSLLKSNASGARRLAGKGAAA